MEIREVRDDEREAAYYLGSQAFMEGSRDISRLDDPDRPDRTTYGVWDSGGLQAVVSVINYSIFLGARSTVAMGGVASVSSLPASRGKGYARACLEYSLERMRDEGQAVSTLFPFSYAYYDRLGWAWTGMRRTYTVKTRVLNAAPETEQMRAATEADRPAIVEAYNRFARNYRGAVVRDDRMWNRVLNNSDTHYRYTYVYEADGGIEAYVSYLGGKRDETRIRELIAPTARSRRAILGLLRRHEMQIAAFKWEAPSDDLLWSALMDWDMKTELQPNTMARVVDVPAAIGAWSPSADVSGSVIVGVTDECAPWNGGAWQLEFDGGRAAAKRTHDSPQVSVDIRALSQAYFGTPTVPDLRAADLLTVHDEAGYDALCRLLEGPPMWMNDSF